MTSVDKNFTVCSQHQLDRRGGRPPSELTLRLTADFGYERGSVELDIYFGSIGRREKFPWDGEDIAACFYFKHDRRAQFCRELHRLLGSSDVLTCAALEDADVCPRGLQPAGHLGLRQASCPQLKHARLRFGQKSAALTHNINLNLCAALNYFRLR